ncbi:MAG: TetR-like C-terminal domain-containing protein [Eubacteriales bacterium]|nr:TetR-like C-terminal domain-containing protein [Eubacteriales bacterium]
MRTVKKNSANTDVRVKNTRQRVRFVFLNLLREKPLHKITVKEICDQAQINRTTFYKHYLDVYDLMDQTEQYVLSIFQEELEGMREQGLEAALTAILTNMKEHIDQYAALFGPNGNSDFLTKISEICYPMFRGHRESSEEERDTRLDQMSYAYISSGCAGILGCWMRYHFEQSPGEIAHLILQMVTLTMDGIAKNLVKRNGEVL